MNIQKPLVTCRECREDIPLDAAFTPEGAEYVQHFCGLECYQLFVESNAKLHAQSTTAQQTPDETSGAASSSK